MMCNPCGCRARVSTRALRPKGRDGARVAARGRRGSGGEPQAHLARIPRIPERPPRFCVPAGRSQTASSQLFVNHALRCFERTRAMVRLPPRVEPSRCLRARRPCRDHAAHPRREFLMVRPDAIEHACDYFPCRHTRIRHIGTWARFAAAHATQLRRLSFPPPTSALRTSQH